MIKRLKTSAGLVAGLAALSLGGAAIAGAATSSTPTHASAQAKQEATSVPDTDTLQSGDQTTPDTTMASTAKEVTTGPDRGTLQSGSQAAPHAAGASQSENATSEASSESSGETAANNDGPGGYADPSGNANTQQQGEH
jgi:hypothetical protein